jgi:hypothetical protein
VSKKLQKINMSDTPRTDTEQKLQESMCGKPAVSVKFARELERELNEQVLCNGKGGERESGLLGKVNFRITKRITEMKHYQICRENPDDAAIHMGELEEKLAKSNRFLEGEKIARRYAVDKGAELERENARLRGAGKALRDALAFECHKIGDVPREIDEWDALVSALPNLSDSPLKLCAITLTLAQWELVEQAAGSYQDEGPHGEGWQSDELSSAVASMSNALRDALSALPNAAVTRAAKNPPIT